MGSPFACLLLTTLTSLLCGNYAIENAKYRPYGPMKCLETCLNSVGISGFITKYHCLRVSTNDSDNPENRSVEESFICLTTHEKVFADLGGKGRADTETKVSKSFTLAEKPGDRTFDQRLRLTTEEIHNEDLKTVQCNKDVDITKTCKKGRLERVKEILSQGLDNINCRGKYERTPVMFAVRFGHEEVFDFLKSQGCDLSALDQFGNTVLHLACKNGNVDLVKKLMDEKKIDVLSRANFGVTPVHQAAGHCNTRVVELYLNKGFGLTEVDNDKNNILHYASMKGCVDVVSYILSKDILSIESRGQYGNTPVMMGVEKCYVSVIKLLLSKGCNPTAVDDYNNNLLHLACMEGCVDVVSFILSKDIIPLESRGDYGETPVMKAAKQCHVSVVRLLLNVGCDPTAVDNLGKTMLHLACFGGCIDVVSFILSKDLIGIESRGHFGQTPIIVAARVGNISLIELLVRKGCNLKEVDDEGDSILHIGCRRGNVDIVKYLVDLPEINKEVKNKEGKTPVQVAADAGHEDVVNVFKARL